MISSLHTFLSIVKSNHIINCHIYKKGDGNSVYDWALRQQPSKRVPLRMWDLGGRRSPATTDGLITLPQCSIATKTHLYLYLYNFADFDLWLCDLKGFMLAPQKIRLRRSLHSIRAIELIAASCPQCKSCWKAPLADVRQTRTIGEGMLSYWQRFVWECKPNCICWSNELECVKKVQVIIALTN